MGEKRWKGKSLMCTLILAQFFKTLQKQRSRGIKIAKETSVWRKLNCKKKAVASLVTRMCLTNEKWKIRNEKMVYMQQDMNLYPWRFSRFSYSPTSRGQLDHLVPGIPSNQYSFGFVQSKTLKQQKWRNWNNWWWVWHPLLSE